MPPVSEDIEYVADIAAKVLPELQGLTASLYLLSDDERLSGNQRRTLRHHYISANAMAAKTRTVLDGLNAMYEKAAWKEGEIQ